MNKKHVKIPSKTYLIQILTSICTAFTSCISVQTRKLNREEEEIPIVQCSTWPRPRMLPRLPPPFFLILPRLRQSNSAKKEFSLTVLYFVPNSFYCFPCQADIFFVTDSATLHAHKAILLPLLPSLASLSCPSCHDHQPLVLLLPGVNAHLLQSALELAYRQNQVGNLESIIGLVMDLPCNHCDHHFESNSEMETHICEKRPDFTCNLCGTLIISSNGLSGHVCNEFRNEDISKGHREEPTFPIESRSLQTEEASESNAKQETSELKRGKRGEANINKHKAEEKTDENHFDEENGQSLDFKQAMKKRLVNIFLD